MTRNILNGRRLKLEGKTMHFDWHMSKFKKAVEEIEDFDRRRDEDHIPGEYRKMSMRL